MLGLGTEILMILVAQTWLTRGRCTAGAGCAGPQAPQLVVIYLLCSGMASGLHMFVAVNLDWGGGEQ